MIISMLWPVLSQRIYIDALLKMLSSVRLRASAKVCLGSGKARSPVLQPRYANDLR
jgi:hypothetical protein